MDQSTIEDDGAEVEVFRNKTIEVRRTDDGYKLKGYGGQLASNTTTVPIDAVFVNGVDLHVVDHAEFSSAGAMIEAEVTQTDDVTYAEIELEVNG